MIMRLVILLLYFNITLMGSETSKCENEANILYYTKDFDSFKQTKILNNIETKNIFNYPSSSFLHTYPEKCELQIQDFVKLKNVNEQIRSEFFCSDDIISNMSEQPKYITDHNIGSIHIDQVIDNGFLAYERSLSYNNTKSDINKKKLQIVNTNMSDVRNCKSNNSEVNRNINHNQNIYLNRTGENKQKPTRLSSFDTLKNYLDFVKSDNMTHTAKDMDIEQQSFNTEIAIHDSQEYSQGKIVKKSSFYYDNLENTDVTHLFSQELAYHNKVIYDQNDFNKEYIDTEINSANNEYIQTYNLNTFHNEVMHQAKHSIHHNSNINLENVEEKDHKQWIFPTYLNRNLQENNIYANYDNYTNLSYPSTFSDNDTFENCYISQNNYTNSGNNLNNENQIFLSDHNCKGYRNDEKSTYLTDFKTTNKSNFNMKNQSSLFKSNAHQDLITDNNLIHYNDNFQTTYTNDLQNEFYTGENSVFDTAKKQNNLHQNDDAYFTNNLTSYKYNSPLPTYFSEEQTNYETYIKNPLLTEDLKRDDQLQLGNNIIISKNEQRKLCDNNDERKTKIINNKILNRKNSYLDSHELKSKNDIFIHTNSCFNKKRKIKHYDENEDKPSDEYDYFENFFIYDKNIVKKHIENIFLYRNVNFYSEEENEKLKIEIFNNKPSYYSMIDYLLLSIIEYFDLENSREDNSNTNNIIYWADFSVVIDLIKKIIVIEENTYFKTYYKNIKMRKYKLKEHALTQTFFSDLKRILNILSDLRFFNLLLPEFLYYNDKYSLESCFKKENDIHLNILQIRYFIALTKFVDKVHTIKTKNLYNQNKNIFINIRYFIRNFTLIALQPFLKCNFRKLYYNLIVKGTKLSTRKIINADIPFNINKVIYFMENILYIDYSYYSYYIRFLFLYIGFQKILEDNLHIFDGVKNFDKRYIYPNISKYKMCNEKELLFNFLILEKCKLSQIFYKFKEYEKYWIPFCKILLIYFDKINNMDFLDKKIKDKIKLIKNKILEFFIPYVVKMEILVLNKKEDKKENERKNVNFIFSESGKIILEIEELEKLELQKVDNILL